MRKRHDTYIQWVVIATVMAALTVGGCSKRNVVATTSGTDGGQTTAKSKETGTSRSGDLGGGDQRGGDSFGLETPKEENLFGKAETGMKAGGDTGAKGGDTSRHVTESLGPIGTGPLQGFNKGAGEERLGDTPLLIAKADPQDSLRKAREDGRKELADIYFAFDKWMLSNEGKKNLASSADFLKQNPNAKLVIEGYCDERGSREYNLVLGEKRAKEARRFLADLGIQNPVSVTSYGKERQVCNDRDESCYWKNRRAHLLLDAEK